MTEAGWYYAQGDPPGTVRRWNGTQWVGFPINQPTGETGGIEGVPVAAATSSGGVRPFAAVSGQTSLKAIAVLAQLALMALGAAYLVLSISLLRLLPYASTDVTQAPDSVLAPAGLAYIAQTLFGVIAGVVFVIWFYMAYRNMSLWHRARRGNFWAVLAWFVPFLNLLRPLTMMLELIERSPRDEDRGSLSPLPAVAWWLLWIFPSFAFLFLILSSDIESAGRNFVVGQAVSAGLGAISIGLAIYLVQIVTNAQEGRRRPSRAQAVLLQQQAELAAFRQNESNGMSFG